jgi:succinate dehydrogenase / fumarate reductase membrane anchor subunit
MVKAVYGVNHQGLRDWLVQHISAFIMAIYTLGLVIFLMIHSGINYASWSMLFASPWMKVATEIVFLLLLTHAWIGVWTVITDYVKCAWLRLTLYVFVLLALVAFFIAAALILWGV